MDGSSVTVVSVASSYFHLVIKSTLRCCARRAPNGVAHDRDHLATAVRTLTLEPV